MGIRRVPHLFNSSYSVSNTISGTPGLETEGSKGNCDIQSVYDAEDKNCYADAHAGYGCAVWPFTEANCSKDDGRRSVVLGGKDAR